MSEPAWEVDVEKTKDHWLEVVEKFDGRVYYRAAVKWDGCIHYEAFTNEGEDGGDREYRHICRLDEEIDRLQRLKKMAQAHFKDHHHQAFPADLP